MVKSHRIHHGFLWENVVEAYRAVWPKECILKEILPVSQLPSRQSWTQGPLREKNAEDIFENSDSVRLFVSFVCLFVCLFCLFCLFVCLFVCWNSLRTCCDIFLHISMFFTYSS